MIILDYAIVGTIQQCSKKWSDLCPTNDEPIRFCATCAESVHLVHNQDDFDNALTTKVCVTIANKTNLDDEDWWKGPHIVGRPSANARGVN